MQLGQALSGEVFVEPGETRNASLDKSSRRLPEDGTNHLL
jgi:hypothetical protein